MLKDFEILELRQSKSYKDLLDDKFENIA